MRKNAKNTKTDLSQQLFDKVWDVAYGPLYDISGRLHVLQSALKGGYIDELPDKGMVELHVLNIACAVDDVIEQLGAISEGKVV